MKLKKAAFLFVLLVVALTSSISYAYFTGIVDIKGSNGGILQKLNIVNGKSEIEINTDNSKWRYGSILEEATVEETKVYIKKPDNWSDSVNVYIYRKSDSGDTPLVGVWPGKEMKNEGDGIYSYTLEGSFFDSNSEIKVIFNDRINQYPTEEGLELEKNNIKILYPNGEWKNYPTGDVQEKDGFAVIENPENNIKVNYDNILVSNKSNLTSKIKLDLDVYTIKEGGSEEDSNLPPEINDDITTEVPEGVSSFAVMVGDEDNFNNLSDHGKLNLFPTAEDAVGTDRRMVTSGFYKWYNSIKNYSLETYYYVKTNNRKDAFLIQNTPHSQAAFYGMTYDDENGNKTEPSIFYDPKYPDIINNIINNGSLGNKIGFLKYTYNGIEYDGERGEVFYDGFTDRAIRRVWQDGGPITDGKWNNNKDFTELQQVEPLTFNYKDKMKDGEKVYNAKFEIKIADLQAKPSEDMWSKKWGDLEWITSFSAKSTTEYKVTLKVVGTNEEIEIKEFATVINNLTQHNVVANLVTLNVPKEYLYLIEEGREKGLELKIDDPTYGTSGDTYCIDYAKLLVNQKMENKATIDGTITDSKGNAIKNAVVTNTNTGEQVLTNDNGYYTFEYVALGQTVIKVEHKNYETQFETIYNVEENKKYTVNFTLNNISDNTSITPNTKFTGNIIIEKYNSLNEKIGETIIEELKIVETSEESKVTISTEDLLVEPGFYYKIAYDLNLFNMKSIDRNAKEFNLYFKSNISATVTQENNPGWEEDGSQQNNQ